MQIGEAIAADETRRNASGADDLDPKTRDRFAGPYSSPCDFLQSLPLVARIVAVAPGSAEVGQDLLPTHGVRRIHQSFQHEIRCGWCRRRKGCVRVDRVVEAGVDAQAGDRPGQLQPVDDDAVPVNFRRFEPGFRLAGETDRRETRPGSGQRAPPQLELEIMRRSIEGVDDIERQMDLFERQATSSLPSRVRFGGEMRADELFELGAERARIRRLFRPAGRQ